MRTGHLYRHKDVNNTSGTGKVAEVVEFENGEVVMAWLSNPSSTAHYESPDELMEIHGHEGNTDLRWDD